MHDGMSVLSIPLRFVDILSIENIGFDGFFTGPLHAVAHGILVVCVARDGSLSTHTVKNWYHGRQLL